MDIQLQELIEKIKKDGVASAENSAKQLISEAEKKAEEIIKEAEEKAEGIIKNAKLETARMEKASEEAIAQAGRNILLSCRERINSEMKAILQDNVEKKYDQDLLKKLIPETVKAWAQNTDAADITVLLSPEDLQALEKNLCTALKDEMSKGLKFGADNSITNGFRIGSDSDASFYDFSSDELVELFSNYLNPKISGIMKSVIVSDADKAKENN